MSIITRNKLKEALKGSGECKTVKAGKRLQYLWRDSSYDGSDPLGDTIELMKHSGNTTILDFICAENGGVFVKNIEAEDSTKTLFQDTSIIFSEASDILRVLSDAGSDGKITQEEGDKIRKEVDEFNKVIFGLLQAVEKGKR